MRQRGRCRSPHRCHAPCLPHNLTFLSKPTGRLTSLIQKIIRDDIQGLDPNYVWINTFGFDSSPRGNKPTGLTQLLALVTFGNSRLKPEVACYKTFHFGVAKGYSLSWSHVLSLVTRLWVTGEITVISSQVIVFWVVTPCIHR